MPSVGFAVLVAALAAVACGGAGPTTEIGKTAEEPAVRDEVADVAAEPAAVADPADAGEQAPQPAADHGSGEIELPPRAAETAKPAVPACRPSVEIHDATSCYNGECVDADCFPAVATDGSRIVSALEVESCIMGSGCWDTELTQFDVIPIGRGARAETVKLITPYHIGRSYFSLIDYSCCDDVGFDDSCDPDACAKLDEDPDVERALAADMRPRVERARELIGERPYRRMLPIEQYNHRSGGSGMVVKGKREIVGSEKRPVFRFEVRDGSTGEIVLQGEIDLFEKQTQFTSVHAWVDEELELLLVAVAEADTVSDYSAGKVDAGFYAVSYEVFPLPGDPAQ